MLALLLAVVALCVALIVTGATMAPPDDAPITTATQTLGNALLVAGIVAVCVAPVLLLMGFSPSSRTRRVLILFGDYKGTVRDEGFHWVTPFLLQRRLHGRRGHGQTHREVHEGLAARTYNGEHLGVNDKCGNPIEIADVIVARRRTRRRRCSTWTTTTTCIRKSETALRHVATTYAYDQMPGEPEGDSTLRSNIEEVSEALKESWRCAWRRPAWSSTTRALTHLAYAPEIAQAMLPPAGRSPVIAAREKIVQGAVSMVDMALAELLGEERGRLGRRAQGRHGCRTMVVLCGESDAQPVLNTNVVPVGRNAAARRPRRAAASASYGEAKNSIPCASIRRCGSRHRTAVADDLRSVNAQVEFVLRRALKDAGRLKDEGGRQPGHPGRTGASSARG